MHTSPWSTGVRWCDGSSWYAAGTVESAGERYSANTPAWSARLRNVLSTPKKTSPIGFDLVRITWLSAAPASPACSTFTWMPVRSSNPRSTRFETANESWVTKVIVVVDAADDGAAVTTVVVALTASATANVSIRYRVQRVGIRRPFRGGAPP